MLLRHDFGSIYKDSANIDKILAYIKGFWHIYKGSGVYTKGSGIYTRVLDALQDKAMVQTQITSFFYSSYRKNAVIAGAIFSQIALVVLAFYAGFIDRCRDFCVSQEADSESVLVRYMRFFAICNTIDIVFCWSLVFFGVHESSPTNTEEEREIHDKKLTENENIEYLIISSMVEMLAMGVYGIVCLVIVPRKCSDGPVGNSFCHTITWVLTVCSIVWGISVCFLHYYNKKAVPSGMVHLPDYAHTLVYIPSPPAGWGPTPQAPLQSYVA